MQSQGTRVSLRSLSVCALLLSVSPAALSKDLKEEITLKAPVQADGLYMEAATFGDVIGLQPGFEQAAMGKPLSITPTRAALTKPVTPATLVKAALNVPKTSTMAAPQQFVQDVAPIEVLDIPAITVEAAPRRATLFTQAELENAARRQQELWKTEYTERLADIKDAASLSLTQQTRTLEAFRALTPRAPVLALTPLSEDGFAQTPETQDPIRFASQDGLATSVETLTKVEPLVQLTGPDQAKWMASFKALNIEPPELTQSGTADAAGGISFASQDGLASTIEALTKQPEYATLQADDARLAPQSVSLDVKPFIFEPTPWEPIVLAATERRNTLYTQEDFAQVDAEILEEIRNFEIVLSARAPKPAQLRPTLPSGETGAPLSDGLTKAESLAVIDMVGLPGDAQMLDVGNEERATLVASVKTSSTKYEAQPIGMGGLETLRDAVEHAVATNPDIKIAEAQQEDAFYAVNEARAGFLPKVDLNAGAGPEISRQSGNEEIVRLRREVNATLRQTVFDFGLTRYDYLRAKQGFESAKLETLQSIEELVYDVSVAYLGVLQQQKVVALAHQNLEAHEGILDLVTAQKEAGQGTAADVNRVSSSLSNARSFMLEEESKLQQARDQYRRLLDAPPGLLIDPLLDLSLLPQSAEEAAQRIEAESPKLLQVKADAISIENQLRSQRGNYLPKVEVEVQGNLNTDLAGETGQTRDARAMMYLRYNIYNGGADVAVASRLRARVKEIGYEFEKQRREVEQDIRNDFTAIDASRAKVSTILNQVTSAKEVVRLYEEQFRAGDRTAFDLLDAQQALISAKLEQVLNTYQENRAAFRVMQQLGTLYYALTSND